MKIIDHPSPNCNARRHGGPPDMVVLHYTAMATPEAALERLCAPEFEVSAHYLIGEDGQLWQLVDEADRAWHAGAGQWGDVTDVNSHAIGIELANPGEDAFEAPQMQRLEGLLADILERWSIPPERVIGHSDMAPDRKSDPGPRFPWRRLAEAGLSVWPEAAASADPGSFADHAHEFGYRAASDHLLRAYQLRFAPQRLGLPLRPEDAAAMASLARRYPVCGRCKGM
ncbi:N-acetylmuramoyl-L-alanine amidase [Halovulum sp. GXIMD14793]